MTACHEALTHLFSSHIASFHRSCNHASHFVLSAILTDSLLELLQSCLVISWLFMPRQRLSTRLSFIAIYVALAVLPRHAHPSLRVSAIGALILLASSPWKPRMRLSDPAELHELAHPVTPAEDSQGRTMIAADENVSGPNDVWSWLFFQWVNRGLLICFSHLSRYVLR